MSTLGGSFNTHILFCNSILLVKTLLFVELLSGFDGRGLWLNSLLLTFCRHLCAASSAVVSMVVRWTVLDFKGTIRTWVGIPTSNLQISRLAIYNLISPVSIDGSKYLLKAMLYKALWSVTLTSFDRRAYLVFIY